jgi:hypothetical protein
MLQAIEVTGTIDEHGQLALDQPLPLSQRRVRAIVLVEAEGDRAEAADWSRLATEQFFNGYSDADVIYDQGLGLRSR